jgi:Phage Tail Collar Domain
LNLFISRAWQSTVAAGAMLLSLGLPQPAAACSADLYLGSVCTTAAPECPSQFREADGRLVRIAEHQGLFALIGTAYGGDGKVTLGLPNLKDRVPIGIGPLSVDGRIALVAETGGGPLQTEPLRYCVKVAGPYPTKN